MRFVSWLFDIFTEFDGNFVYLRLIKADGRAHPALHAFYLSESASLVPFNHGPVFNPLQYFCL